MNSPEVIVEVLRLAHGEGRAITVLGLLALIATPIMRVAISVLTFIEQKDKRRISNEKRFLIGSALKSE